jgi:Tfp pilus assembly protein PilX
MKNKNNQKGFSIYLVLVILAILLSVSLNISSIIITASKMTGNLGDGVRAFHAADSGIEAALYSTKNSCIVTSPNNVLEDTNFTYTLTITGSCPSTGTSIISEGKYKTNAKRIMEVKW